MATQPVVPRLPVCTALLAQLRGEGADPDDIAALLARDSDTLLAGTAAFRRPTSASAAALTAHGFTHDGVGGAPPTKVIIGTATEQLVRDLVPKLVGAARLDAWETRSLQLHAAHAFCPRTLSLHQHRTWRRPSHMLCSAARTLATRRCRPPSTTPAC